MADIVLLLAVAAPKPDYLGRLVRAIRQRMGAALPSYDPKIDELIRPVVPIAPTGPRRRRKIDHLRDRLVTLREGPSEPRPEMIR